MLFILIFVAYIGAIIMGHISKKRSKEFEEFLNKNAYEILNGNGCEFHGTIYTKDTRIVRYRYCVSVIIITFTRTTYYEPIDSAGTLSILAFLITFLSGWWGFPWGPIKTIDSFIKNASKADSILIEDLYNI